MIRAQEEYDELPESLRDGVKLYIEQGVPTGGFLEAVISNDLRGAFSRADAGNRFLMYDIVSWFHMYAPGNCWGCAANYCQWVKDHAEARRARLNEEMAP